MLRNQRLDDVSCAVCMEDLFHRRDDLDEIMPIATPDCGRWPSASPLETNNASLGHVFHERCLLEWFRTQTLRYVAQAREQGLGTRIGRSPSPSDAPVECPTCRNECFADPETGEPSIHRLFIHFGDGGGHRSSSQIDSSPVQWRSTQGKEKEVMGLARRARGLTEEVKALSGESHEDDVVGMMRRVEALKNDVVSIKALTGIKVGRRVISHY